MAYAEELLEFAQELANLHPDAPHQPSLRRAVSTAYDALFHLLISEATKTRSRGTAVDRAAQALFVMVKHRARTCWLITFMIFTS